MSAGAIEQWMPKRHRCAILSDTAMTSIWRRSPRSGGVADSGEGRWTVIAAIDEGAPAPVLSASLFERFSSRGEDLFSDKLQSAMRYEFGGHSERKNGA